MFNVEVDAEDIRRVQRLGRRNEATHVGSAEQQASEKFNYVICIR